MISWLTWPVDWLARRLSGRRAEKIQEALSEARYVDVREWAKLNRMSPSKAEEELERGVKAGILQKMFLYEGNDSPINFLVPESRLDKPLRLSEVGYISEEDDPELLVSKLRTRTVYVAAEGEAEGYVHAA